MYKTRKGFGHITAKAAAEHANKAQPKRIWTTHHDPNDDFATIQEIARTVKRESGVPTDFAMEGTEF